MSTITIQLEPITDAQGDLVFTFANGVVARVPCAIIPGNVGLPVQPQGVVLTGAE